MSITTLIHQTAKRSFQAWRWTSLLLVLLATQVYAPGQETSDAEQSRIMALENAWNQAVHAKDTTALKLLLAPELVYVDYDGKLMDKEQYLVSVQSPAMLPARVVSESMNVKLYGTVAMVHGVYRESGMRNGKPYTLRERFTDAWTRQSGTWMCVSSHSTLIEER
jgi:ketosteroid isomerase-like protein